MKGMKDMKGTKCGMRSAENQERRSIARNPKCFAMVGRYQNLCSSVSICG